LINEYKIKINLKKKINLQMEELEETNKKLTEKTNDCTNLLRKVNDMTENNRKLNLELTQMNVKCESITKDLNRNKK